jgi:hypothetical protein
VLWLQSLPVKVMPLQKKIMERVAKGISPGEWPTLTEHLPSWYTPKDIQAAVDAWFCDFCCSQRNNHLVP